MLINISYEILNFLSTVFSFELQFSFFKIYAKQKNVKFLLYSNFLKTAVFPVSIIFTFCRLQFFFFFFCIQIFLRLQLSIGQGFI